MKHAVEKNGNGRVSRNRRSGFTLVELIVTMVILAIVAAITVPAFVGHIDKARAKECEATREALAAKIVSAKLAHDIDGTSVLSDGSGIMVASAGSTFDVQDYIDKSDFKCPSHGAYTYDPAKDEITCSSHPDAVSLNGTGGYNVTVKNDKSTEKETNVPPSTPGGSGSEGGGGSGKDEGESNKTEHTYTYVIEKNPLTLSVGQTETLQVHVTDETSSSVPESQVQVTGWTDPANGCAKVTSSSGSSAIVTAMSAGSGTISCTVTVTEAGVTKMASGNPVAVTVVSPTNGEPEVNGEPQLNVPIELTIKEGSGQNLNASVTDQGGNPYPGVTIEYTSNDSGTATVDESGNVHGARSGRCNVTVTVKDEEGNVLKQATVPVTVTGVELHIELTLLPVSQILKVGKSGKTLEAAAVVKDTYGTAYPNTPVTLNWSNSDNETVKLTVDSRKRRAEATGLQAGKSTVTVVATAGELSASKTAEVIVEKESNLFKPEYNPLLIEQSDVAETINNISNYLNLCVAEGKEGGTWKGVGANGQEILNVQNNTLAHDPTHVNDIVTFTYTFEGVSENISAFVVHPLKDMQIDVKNYDLEVGDVQTLTVQRCNPEYSTDRITEWRVKEGPGSECVRVLNYEEMAARIEAIAPGEAIIEVVAPRTRGSLVEPNAPERNPLIEEIRINVRAKGSSPQPTNPGITGVELKDVLTSLQVGHSADVEAQIITSGASIDMSKVSYEIGAGWNSTGGSVQVQQEGNRAKITAINGPTATVYVKAKYNGTEVASQNYDITIYEGENDLRGISVDPVTILEDESFQIQVKTEPENADMAGITYKYTDEQGNWQGKVSVTEEGVVTGLNTGTAQIKVAAYRGDRKVTECTFGVTVNENPAKLKGISASSIVAWQGETVPVQIQIIPETANMEGITYEYTFADPDMGTFTDRQFTAGKVGSYYNVGVQALKDGTTLDNIKANFNVTVASTKISNFEITPWSNLRQHIQQGTMSALQEGQLCGEGQINSWGGVETSYYVLLPNVSLTWEEDYNDNMTFADYVSKNPDKFVKVNADFVYYIPNASEKNWCNFGVIYMKDGKYYVCINKEGASPKDESQFADNFIEIIAAS